jgi:hypothetical protein
VQATGKAEKQVDKASDKVGSAAKEVSHGSLLIVLVRIPIPISACDAAPARHRPGCIQSALSSTLLINYRLNT